MVLILICLVRCAKNTTLVTQRRARVVHYSNSADRGTYRGTTHGRRVTPARLVRAMGTTSLGGLCHSGVSCRGLGGAVSARSSICGVVRGGAPLLPTSIFHGGSGCSREACGGLLVNVAFGLETGEAPRVARWRRVPRYRWALLLSGVARAGAGWSADGQDAVERGFQLSCPGPSPGYMRELFAGVCDACRTLPGRVTSPLISGSLCP